MSAYNCEGFAMLFIDIPDYNENTIRSTLVIKKIKALRVSGDNTFAEVNLTEEDQDHLIRVLKCLR